MSLLVYMFILISPNYPPIPHPWTLQEVRLTHTFKSSSRHPHPPLRILHLNLLGGNIKGDPWPHLHDDVSRHEYDKQDPNARTQNRNGDIPVVLLHYGDFLNFDSDGLLPGNLLDVVDEPVVLLDWGVGDGDELGDDGGPDVVAVLEGLVYLGELG